MKSPILSVIIPSYNSSRYLGACLESLRREKFEGVEYIFIDGGSTDRTMEIIEENRDLFEIVISEKDNGQSDAFNKGFASASGDYFTWLNSDDVFCPGSLKKAVEWISRERRAWYAANVIYIDSDSNVIRCCKSGAFEKWALGFGILNVFGPSTIFHRKIFKKLGGFREDFNYCMDTEYWWRIVNSGEQFDRIPIYLWGLRLHEESKTSSSIVEGRKNRPVGMKAEGARMGKMYYHKVGENSRAVGKALVRGWRIFTGSYVKAYWDTRRFTHRKIEDIEGRL